METFIQFFATYCLPVIMVAGMVSSFVLFCCVLRYAMEKYAQWLVDGD